MNTINPEHSHLSWTMLIRLAITNIRYKMFRSVITIGGVVLGVGSVYALLSFGLGVQNLVQHQVLNNQAINTIDITSTNADIIQVTPELVKKIGSIQHVVSAGGLYTSSAKIELGSAVSDTVIYGADNNYIQTSNLSLEDGKLFDETTPNEAIVNTAFLQSIGIEDTSTAIGKKVTVTLDDAMGDNPQDKEVVIVGIIASSGGTEMYVSPKFFETQNMYTFAQIRVSIDESTNIPIARQAIESMGLETTSPIDTVNQINDVFRFFNLALIGIGSIGMVIAILGMLNTLTVSLLERTREIGLMMIIGARKKDVRRLFITEAVVLSTLGGVIGLILASIVGFIIDGVLNVSAQQRGVTESFSVFYESPLLIIGILIFTVLIGVVVGLIPAYRAARIDPIEALRHD